MCNCEKNPKRKSKKCQDKLIIKKAIFTVLEGSTEIPPVKTKAKGLFVIKSTKDRKSLKYKLSVENIKNVTQAHLHFGINGPIVYFLFKFIEPLRYHNGLLAKGVIDEHFLLNNLNCGTTEDLIREIYAGNIAVNVHTVKYPCGEIGGGIRMPTILN